MESFLWKVVVGYLTPNEYIQFDKVCSIGVCILGTYLSVVYAYMCYLRIVIFILKQGPMEEWCD